MAEILLSIPLAVTLFLLSGLFKKNYLKAGLVIVVVFVISFLSIIGFPSNQTNRTFSKNQIVRFTFTTSESQALQTISTIYDGMIGMDDFYTTVKFTPESFIGTVDCPVCHQELLVMEDHPESPYCFFCHSRIDATECEYCGATYLKTNGPHCTDDFYDE